MWYEMQLPTQLVNYLMNLGLIFSPGCSLFDRCDFRVVAGHGQLVDEANILPRAEGSVVIEQLSRQCKNMFFLCSKERSRT